MIPKLQEYMNDSRIPLFLRKRNDTIYFQLQVEVAREDGLCAGTYCEFSKISTDAPLADIGLSAKKILARFHEISDLTLPEFRVLTGMDMDSYEVKEAEERLSLMQVKSEKELNEAFDECIVEYDVLNNNYSFTLSFKYKKGNRKLRSSSSSTGEKGIITFDEPLEFEEDVASEHLGEMILEAFDRSRKMAEVMSSDTLPAKEVDPFDGTVILVTPPDDKHFADYEDAGVGEIYQDYAYIAREGAESSADFMLTMAPELYEDLSCENIRSAWLEAFGDTDDISVTETQYGIYQYRAEMRNKKMYRIAYFRQLNDGTALECCMEMTDPSKKKKLAEKLPPLFEQFALQCKIK